MQVVLFSQESPLTRWELTDFSISRSPAETCAPASSLASGARPRGSSAWTREDGAPLATASHYFYRWIGKSFFKWTIRKVRIYGRPKLLIVFSRRAPGR